MVLVKNWYFFADFDFRENKKNGILLTRKASFLSRRSPNVI